MSGSRLPWHRRRRWWLPSHGNRGRWKRPRNWDLLGSKCVPGNRHVWWHRWLPGDRHLLRYTRLPQNRGWWMCLLLFFHVGYVLWSTGIQDRDMRLVVVDFWQVCAGCLVGFIWFWRFDGVALNDETIDIAGHSMSGVSNIASLIITVFSNYNFRRLSHGRAGWVMVGFSLMIPSLMISTVLYVVVAYVPFLFLVGTFGWQFVFRRGIGRILFAMVVGAIVVPFILNGALG